MKDTSFRRSLPFESIPDNQSVETEVDNMALMLHRRGNQVFATGVYCPHAEVRLDPRNCFGDWIVCKAHGYRSNVKTGECQEEPDIKLNTFPAVVEEGYVWVKLI